MLRRASGAPETPEPAPHSERHLDRQRSSGRRGPRARRGGPFTLPARVVAFVPSVSDFAAREPGSRNMEIAERDPRRCAGDWFRNRPREVHVVIAQQLDRVAPLNWAPTIKCRSPPEGNRQDPTKAILPLPRGLRASSPRYRSWRKSPALCHPILSSSASSVGVITVESPADSPRYRVVVPAPIIDTGDAHQRVALCRH
jgi:hypothetical protein